MGEFILDLWGGFQGRRAVVRNMYLIFRKPVQMGRLLTHAGSPPGCPHSSVSVTYKIQK